MGARAAHCTWHRVSREAVLSAVKRWLEVVSLCKPAARGRACAARGTEWRVRPPTIAMACRPARPFRHVTLACVAAAALAVTACAAGSTRAGDDAYAQRLAKLVNEYRTRHGAETLAADPALTRLAHEHSAAMARAGRMSHDGFPGRAQRSGYAICVENVGWNYATAEEQFAGWRESAGHEGNMRDRRVERIGIATVDRYTTMLACGRQETSAKGVRGVGG